MARFGNRGDVYFGIKEPRVDYLYLTVIDLPADSIGWME